MTQCHTQSKVVKKKKYKIIDFHLNEEIYIKMSIITINRHNPCLWVLKSSLHTQNRPAIN